MSELAEPAVPRAAATVVLVRDDPFEVLMVQRNARGTFPSAIVFPGGVLESSDADEAWHPLLRGAVASDASERAWRIAAVRECFEETGVLLVTGASELAEAPDARTPFLEVVRASGGVIDFDGIVPFGHWVTPIDRPKRFDTRFFLAAAPAGQSASADGGEIVGLDWVRPGELAARVLAGEPGANVMFPTLMNLLRLTESSSPKEALAAARARPRFVVEPRIERRNGVRWSLIPVEADYPFTEYPAP
ncbi:MAG: NUDIX hydrolase [Herbiconiux sp.]|uniref:NUDIX hydrolase n=1 Tax=Herbiconiux sp. TaxID=1871186 RepID=UPI001226F0AD|nr:NUDIX hydrolase [Herbiconiux sp.]TAJ48205.1 MAG: NUDIX hydrolase [Herbiconiux sp.]